MCSGFIKTHKQHFNYKITLPNGGLISTIVYFYILKMAKINLFNILVYQKCW